MFELFLNFERFLFLAQFSKFLFTFVFEILFFKRFIIFMCLSEAFLLFSGRFTYELNAFMNAFSTAGLIRTGGFGAGRVGLGGLILSYFKQSN